MAGTRSMIKWLSGKDPDVWFASTSRLNWDDAFPVLQWIISQPDCDKANAAMIFWLSEPNYQARLLVQGQQPSSEAWQLVDTVLRNWRAGFYRRSELSWPDGTDMPKIDHFVNQLNAVPGGAQALGVPEELLRPFAGRAPRLAPSDLPEENAEVWDLFYRLGTWCGNRPGSEAWLADRDPQVQHAKKRKGEIAMGLFFLGVAAAFGILALVLSQFRP
jgi:hypothetical protein